MVDSPSDSMNSGNSTSAVDMLLALPRPTMIIIGAAGGGVVLIGLVVGVICFATRKKATAVAATAHLTGLSTQLNAEMSKVGDPML